MNSTGAGPAERRKLGRRLRRWLPAGSLLGKLLIVVGASMVLPAAVGLSVGESTGPVAFGCVGLAVAIIGALLALRMPSEDLSWNMNLLFSVGAWTLCAVIGAIPIWLTLDASYVDALFEATSGFTTTGFTLLHGLEELPRSVLFWRVQMQWLGGLGILSFFLLVSFPGGEAFRLLMLESADNIAQRPAPGIRSTIKILWQIYAGLTVLNFLALLVLGAGAFNALGYALATISTGGFGLHDANIGHFQASGHPNALAIELVTMAFMLISGISFLSHYMVLARRRRHSIIRMETRAYWVLFALATLILLLEAYAQACRTEGVAGIPMVISTLRPAVFQTAALTSGAGFATRPLSFWSQCSAGLQALFVLMLIGGCSGSTAGGLKVLRLQMLRRFVWHYVRRLVYPRRYVMPFTVEGRIIPDRQLVKMVVVSFLWIALAAFGSILTALVAGRSPVESFSVSLSAVSNMGPCLLAPASLAVLPVVLKGIYMLLMLAGRLEIVPILALFLKPTWR